MIKKILVIKTRALGDSVLLLAPLHELIRLYPDAKIDVLVTEAWASLFNTIPGIFDVISFRKPKGVLSRLTYGLRLGWRLWQRKYDEVICFHASPTSAALAFATRAPVRSVHFHGHQDKNRYATVKVPGKGILKPIIERDMDAVRALGFEIPSGQLPRLKLTDNELDDARARVIQLGLRAPILGLGLGASRPTKKWPVERFAELAQVWVNKTGGSVVAITSRDEKKDAELFLSVGPVDQNITCLDPGDIKKLAVILSQFSVFCGNDSGPRHLAAAVGIPTMTLFGPEDPFEWHPYPSDRHPRLFIKNLPCRNDAAPGMPEWCAVQTCVLHEHRCMRELKVDQVFTLCKGLLNEKGIRAWD